MNRAKSISTNGAYLEAVIEIQGQHICVMDEFSVCESSTPKLGSEFEFEFTPMIDEGESWETIFSGNPEGRMGIEQIDGWRYRAFCKIVSVNPVVVDCGLFQTEGVVHSSDPILVGEAVAFIITRLCGYAHAI